MNSLGHIGFDQILKRLLKERLFMILRRAILASLTFGIVTCAAAQQPDMSGAWNGTVCKGQGDMLVSGSSTPEATVGYIHLELTPANSGNPDVRYDVDVTTFDQNGVVRDHHSIPYEPIHYGHGVQPDNSNSGKFFFQADARNPANHADGRVIDFSFSGRNGSMSGNGSYSHYIFSPSGMKTQYVGEVEFSIQNDGRSVQQYIAAHRRPCP